MSPGSGPGQRRAALPLLLAVLVSLACVPAARLGPASFETEVGAPTRARLGEIETVAAFGDLEVEVDGRRVIGRVRALYVAPSRVRIDADLPGFLGFFGGQVTLWASPEVLLWLPSDGGGLQAGVDDPLLGDLLGRAPRFEDLAVLLLGLPAWWPDPLDPETPQPAVDSEVHGAPPRGRLSLRFDDGLVEVGRIGGEPSALLELERRDPDGVLASVVFDGHEERHGLALPARVTLRSPRRGGLARFRWKRYEIDRGGDAERLEWPL